MLVKPRGHQTTLRRASLATLSMRHRGGSLLRVSLAMVILVFDRAPQGCGRIPQHVLLRGASSARSMAARIMASDEQAMEELMRGQPIGRLGCPEKIAAHPLALQPHRGFRDRPCTGR